MTSLPLDDFVKPEDAPEEYIHDAEVVAWRELDNGKVILEVFWRTKEALGYRYQAWVAWRDAGNEIRDHSWFLINPRDTLINDSLPVTIALAEDDARTTGLQFTSEWHLSDTVEPTAEAIENPITGADFIITPRSSVVNPWTLNCTRRLLNSRPNADNPREELIEILYSAIELVFFPDNDLSWSHWNNEAEAVGEIKAILSVIESGGLPDRLTVGVLFAPTGPIQEVSLSEWLGSHYSSRSQKDMTLLRNSYGNGEPAMRGYEFHQQGFPKAHDAKNGIDHINLPTETTNNMTISLPILTKVDRCNHKDHLQIFALRRSILGRSSSVCTTNNCRIWNESDSQG